MSEPSTLPDLGGKYQPLYLIASHPRTLTFAARDAVTQQPVFLKMLHESRRGDMAAARAFRNEPLLLRWLAGRAAAGLAPPVLDSGDWDGRPYFVQPLLPGWNLARAMRGRPAFPGTSALKVMERCLTLLHLLHGAGGIHGDVSPENIFIITDAPVPADGTLPAEADVCLVDFDAARRLDGPENRPGTPVVGKAPYLAPECAAGQPFAPQSDLYALGIVFYEMLAGDRPYHAASLQEVRGLTEQSVPPIPLALGVPSVVEDLLRALLAVDSARRIGTAAEALRRLRSLLDVHRWLAAAGAGAVREPRLPAAAPVLRREARSSAVPLGPPREPEPREEAHTPQTVRVESPRRVPAGVEESSPAELAMPPTGAIPAEASAPVPVTAAPPADDREEVLTGLGEPSESSYLADLATPPPGAIPGEVAAAVPKTAAPPADDREEVVTACSEVPEPSSRPPEPLAPMAAEVTLDENVQFTVYRPKAVRPEKWYPLLAFAHLAERPADAAPDEPDPVAEVKRQAAQVLGAQTAAYQGVTQDSRQALPRAGEITFLPEVAGFDVNPPQRTFRWQEAVHREEFRLRAPPSLDGQTARGRLSVFWGPILLAEVALAIRVDSGLAPVPEDAPSEAEPARRYRKIFASYSHKDREVVEQVGYLVKVLGDRYLRDWIDLRAGEAWNDRLKELIAEADVFQLFWSRNSMHSPFVRQEWEYALALSRPNFIRPTYWEDPLPSAPEADLPPEALRRLHFQRLTPPVAPTVVGLESLATEPSDGGRRDRLQPADADEEAGPRIGPYVTVRRLGLGGMGSIRRARHATLGSEVVIKLLPEGEYNRELNRALLEEARHAARLRNPRIARLLDAGRHEGQVYLVREYIEGQTLADWLRGQRPTVAEVVALGTRMAEVLHDAHEAGFVHRDLKPAKVLREPDGNPTFLADHFVLREGGAYLALARLTAGQIYGTPSYLSPERIQGELYHDRRSDVYALGVILFELLTSVRPIHQTGGVSQLLKAILTAEPPSPRALRPEVPAALEVVCLKCLRKDPAERYATAADVSAALRLASR